MDETVHVRRVGQGRGVVQTLFGPLPQRTQLVSGVAIVDREGELVLRAIVSAGRDIERVVGSVDEGVVSLMERSAAAAATMDPTAPILDAEIAGKNWPSHISGPFVMVSHGDPFGPAAPRGGCWDAGVMAAWLFFVCGC